MRSAFASLTSRLVLITVALVALVSMLLALATTLVLRTYLMDQLDGKVQGSLQRAVDYYTHGGGPPGSLPVDPDRDGDVHGNGIGTVSALFTAGTSTGT